MSIENLNNQQLITSCIWQDNQLTLYQLAKTGYQQTHRSQFFPDLDWQLLAEYVLPQQQPQAIKAFLARVKNYH